MTQTFQLYGHGHPAHEPAPPQRSDLPSELVTDRGTFAVDLRRFRGGASDGVEMLRISGPRAGCAILPTRGMGIWVAWANETPFGWQSPVRGPVHPARVALWDPSGVGWLEGFDELLVRCGLESNGAPEFDDNNRLRYPLHGRIANLSAESLEVTTDASAGTVEVTGVVRESRLFFANLTLRSTVRMQADEDWIEVVDTVTNEGDQPQTHQMLYHINLGLPLLGPGAELVTPAAEIVPKDARAAEGIDSQATYGPPEPGFAEQVYLMRMQSDEEGWTRALLRSADGNTGFGLRYDTSTLPYFIQWKNTGGQRDGYVTGLEPATNFPNTRSFETSQGRVVHLEPGESVTYRMRLYPLCGADRVGAFADQVRALEKQPPTIARVPRPGWSP